MVKKNLLLVLIMILAIPVATFAQKKAKADKETIEWRYEIEATQTGVQGTYQIKVWSYSKDANVAAEQAKKNAVHGIIFRGFASSADGRVKGQKPLTNNPNLEQEQEKFFKEFFADGGKYQKYVNYSTNATPERIKIGKEYKVGVIVSVNVSELRKDLEQAGIIKSLSAGF